MPSTLTLKPGTLRQPNSAFIHDKHYQGLPNSVPIHFPVLFEFDVPPFWTRRLPYHFNVPVLYCTLARMSSQTSALIHVGNVSNSHVGLTVSSPLPVCLVPVNGSQKRLGGT